MESISSKGPIQALRRRFEHDARGEAIFPLAVLTAIYFFDEFDTSAFATLAPDIQRSFGLTDEEFIGLVIVNVSLVVLLAVPMGYLADRVRRTKLVVLSGLLAGFFSLGTGLATSIALLSVARFGNGIGVLANIPLHNSMLADYYTPDARPTVFARHTNALYVGAIFGPALAGISAALFGWRAAFFIVFVPILITTVYAVRLVEPPRGGTDPGGAVNPASPPPKFREAVRTLWAVRTLRRTYWASVFVGAGLIPLAAYLPLFFEREFGLEALPRGFIGAANAAATYVGVRKGGEATAGWFAQGMHVPMEKVGIALGAVGLGIAVLAASPWLAVTIVIGLVANYVLGYFFAPLAAIQALVSPARERTLSFSLGAIFLVFGVIALFAVGLGGISDAHGIRWGLAVLAPMWIIGGLIARTAGQFVNDDMAKAFAPDPDPAPGAVVEQVTRRAERPLRAERGSTDDGGRP